MPRFRPAMLILLLFLLTPWGVKADLPDTLEAVTPSIVAIGTYQRLRQPQWRFSGTGFVVADGRHVITNHHVLPLILDLDRREALVALAGRGQRTRMYEAEVRAQDEEKDLALLRLSGAAALPPLRLGNSLRVREGESVAFTGFPIGTVLGLYPTTHRGIVSTISPIAIPVPRGRDLSARALRRLTNPFDLFQLDATAYPGNSGSPLFDPDSGLVLGVINRVFVKESKEALLERPSGITYAIPAQYVRALLKRAGLE